LPSFGAHLPDLYDRYRSDGWQIARDRIGQDLRKQYELSQELPHQLLALVRELDNKSADLALAASHVARGQIIVAGQQERIARLKALGCSTLDHEQTLNVFLGTLQIFVEHERTLRRDILLIREQSDSRRSVRAQ
jgi:hypothetical protein